MCNSAIAAILQMISRIVIMYLMNIAWFVVIMIWMMSTAMVKPIIT